MRCESGLSLEDEVKFADSYDKFKLLYYYKLSLQTTTYRLAQNKVLEFKLYFALKLLKSFSGTHCTNVKNNLHFFVDTFHEIFSKLIISKLKRKENQ